MKKTIKVAMIGLGRVAMGVHLKELTKEQDKFQVVAACDPLQERRDAVRDQLGCRTYENIEDLLREEKDVELIDIATRSSDHAKHAIIGLKAGKNVFVEKPMAINYDEALQMIAADHESAGDLFVRQNRRFDSSFLRIQEIISSGKLGDIYMVKMYRHQNYNRRSDWQTIKEFGGGQLLNWGPHVIDQAVCLLDSPVKSMWSDLKKIAATGDAEDHVKIVLKGENERVIDLEISGGIAIPSPKNIIYGTKGTMVHDGGKLHLKYLDPNVEIPKLEANPETTTGGYQNKEELPWVEETIDENSEQKHNLWEKMYLAIREGKEYFVSPERAAEVMRIISEAKKGTEFQVK